MRDRQIGYGKSYASFGEIVQGRLKNQNDFLVTLPVDLWRTCELICSDINGKSRVVIDSKYGKSRNVAERMLYELGLQIGKEVIIKFTRNIPIGKGLSSSTADMLSVVRAFQEMFGVIITESFISRIFHEIEPHDALHFFSCTIYNHRKGVLLERLNYIPQYKIIGIDGGGTVDTQNYNNNLQFTHEDMEVYQSIYEELVASFKERDDYRIACCATLSAKQHIKRSKNIFLEKIIGDISAYDSIGIIATHSGTCAGLIFPVDVDDAVLDDIEKEVSILGNVFRVNTLRVLV